MSLPQLTITVTIILIATISLSLLYRHLAMISPQRNTTGENKTTPNKFYLLTINKHGIHLNFSFSWLSTSFVHGRLPYDSIKPDVQLRNLLCTIKQRKIVCFFSLEIFFPLFLLLFYSYIFLSSFKVFTNSDRIHAMRALDRLGISDCFEQIICFETINPNLPNSTRPDEFPVLLKPSLDAFRIALDAANVEPRRTVRPPWTAFIVYSHFKMINTKISNN